MFKSIIWYTKFVLCLVLKTPQLRKSKKILKQEGQKAHDAFVYPIVSKWAAARIKDSGAKITVHHLERIPSDTNVLFVSNHQSDFDIAIFLGLIQKPTGFVAKVEMEKVPLLRDWMRAIHCVFMDRHNMKQSMQTIIAAINNLKAGYSMVIFPEGTRSKCSKLGEFKAGSFKLATKSKVPLVPVSINGSYQIMEGNHYKIKAASVDVYIHEPIDTAALSKEEIAALPQRVERIIADSIENPY